MASILFVLAIVWGIALVWFWRQEQAGRVTPGRHRDLLAGTFLGLLVLGFFWRTVTAYRLIKRPRAAVVYFVVPASGRPHPRTYIRRGCAPRQRRFARRSVGL